MAAVPAHAPTGSPPSASPPTSAPPSEAELRYARDRLRSEQSMLRGALGGGIAATIGAVAWAAVTVATGYQIGWMAVAIGVLVGFAVRTLGKGIDPMFGVLGAGLALLGCALGNLLTIAAMIAAENAVPILTVLGGLDATLATELMVATFAPMDLVFYGIAIYEGYKLSLRSLPTAAPAAA